MPDKRIIGYITAFLTILVWGVTFISTKELLADFTPFQILFIRFAIGWLALCVIAPGSLKVNSLKHELWFALAGIFGVTLYFLCENQALTYTLASNVSIIVSTTPFFTALLGIIVFPGKKPCFNFYIGFAIAIGGIALISYNGQNFQLNPFGDILALLASLAWAAYSVLTTLLSQSGYGSIKTTRRIFFYGLLFMLPLIYWLPLDIAMSDLIKPINVINILFLGIGASALCFATWTFALKCLGANQASAFIYLVPVVTIISAALILNEPITLLSILGTFLTLSGLIISEWRGLPKRLK